MIRGSRRALGALTVIAIAALPGLIIQPSAFAQGKDLDPSSTVKGGGDSTTKDTGKDLSTGTVTTLTTTPLGTGTGKIKKPPTSATEATTEAPSASASASASASTEDGSDATEPKPSASSTGASDQPVPFERHKVSLEVGDFALSVGAPGNWPKMADADLPSVDAIGTEDAKVTIVVKKGWGFHQPDAKPAKVAEVVVVCGKTSGEYWGDSIRDAAFSQMLDAVEKEAQNYTTLKDIEPDPVRNEGDRIVQPFHADAPFSGDGGGKVDVKEAGEQGKKPAKALSTVKLQGVSFFGFKNEASGPATLLACTITCAHLVSEGDKGVCGSVIQSLEVSGTFAPAPKASWFAEMVFAFKRDKTTGWLIVIGVVFAFALVGVVIVMLMRRKKGASATLTGAHDVLYDGGQGTRDTRDTRDTHDAHDAHDGNEEEEGFNAGYEAGLAAARASASTSGNPPPISIVSSQPSDPMAATALAVPTGSTGAPPRSSQGDAWQASPPPPQGYIDPGTLERRV